MKLSKKITATAAATALASAALLTPVANAQTAENGTPAPGAPAEGDNGAGEEQPGAGEEQPGAGNENEPAGSDNMSKQDKIAAGIGGTIVGLGVLGAVLGNAGDKAEDEAEAPKDGEKEEAPAAEAPAKEDIEAPAAEAPAAEAPAAEAPAVEAAPAEGRNVQLANTGVKPEISILAGLALISMVAGAWMMFSRRQA